MWHLPGLSADIKREREPRISSSVTAEGASRPATLSTNLPNAPQVLDLWVRADFDDEIDPVVIDRDWSGTTDVYTTRAHDAGKIDEGWWNADSDLSVRNPGLITAPLTVSARLDIKNAGEYATIYTMFAPSGLTAGALRLKIEARSSSTRLTLESLTTLAWLQVWNTDVSPGPLDVTLAVIPAKSRAQVLVNGDQVGSVGFTKTAFGTSGAVQFDRNGSNVFVDWYDVRIGGTLP
jgi:hypothetical protein